MSGIPPPLYGAPMSNWNAAFPPAAISRGYSINVTTIPTPAGPPIAALILKRKRKRRRNRGAKQEAGGDHQPHNEAEFDHFPHFVTPIASNRRHRQRFLSIGISETNMSAERTCVSPSMSVAGGAGGSCPDLSEQQMQMWDDILFRAVQNERDALEHKADLLTKGRRRTTHSAIPSVENSDRSNTPMRTSIYEICAPVEMDAGGEAIDLNGNHASLSASPKDEAPDLVSKEEGEEDEGRSTGSLPQSPPTNQTNTQRLAEKLRQELEDLQFRHTHEWQRADGSFIKGMTNPMYDDQYPQNDFIPSHLTTFDSNRRTFATAPLSNGRRDAEEEEADDRNEFDSEYFASMNIRVNPFEVDNDIELTEADCPPPSRFQLLQYAIQRQKAKYDEQLQTPQRVCCSLM